MLHRRIIHSLATRQVKFILQESGLNGKAVYAHLHQTPMNYSNGFDLVFFVIVSLEFELLLDVQVPLLPLRIGQDPLRLLM